MPQRRRRNPTRYQRETGEKLPRWQQKLAQYEAEGGYFVHFSKYAKGGVYPTNKFDTPTGFYAYPLSFLPERISSFATDRPYAIIFKPVRARLMSLKTYSVKDYQRDLALLHDAFGRFDVTDWKREARVQTPAGRMWNITRHLANNNVAKWTKMLYDVLGYDGVVDDCMSIIHTSEPCQAVFFDMRTGSPGAPQNEKVKVVDILEKGSTNELRRVGMKFGRKDLSRANLRGANLEGAKMAGMSLVFANLNGANLRYSDLSAANASNADFTDAQLQSAILADTKLTKAIVIGADLTGADLTGADLSRANLRGANLEGAKMSDTVIEAANLYGANLRQSDLSYANANGADFTDAQLQSATFSVANMRNAILVGADLNGADLTVANLTGADVRGAKLRGANLRGANLRGVKWDDDTTWPSGFNPTFST